MIRHAPSIGLGLGLSLRGSGGSGGVGFRGLLDQYPGAAAAYSLRALSSGWLAGDVVEVRRSSDSASLPFTANQITNGDLVDFVNSNWSDTASTDNTADWTTVDGTIAFDTDHYVVTYSAPTQWAFIDQAPALVAGAEVTFSVDVKSGTGGDVDVTAGASRVGGNQVVQLLGTSSSEWQTLSATYNAGGVTFENPSILFALTSGNIQFKNFTVTQKIDGYVSTWYDQSGNANDATQGTTTAQPKIVDAGALVTGGIDFDGVDDLLSNGSLTLGATVTAYSVTNSTAKGNSSYIYSINGTSGIVDFTDPSGFASIFAGTSLKASTDISGVDVLKSSLFNGANSNIRVNGASVATGTSNTQLANGTLVIGGGGIVADRMLGTIKEIIIYDSDQSANRTGIEANINAAYSIY